MILTCPSCRTRYQTGSAPFKAPGRNVRCAKCGHVWFQSTPELEMEPEPETIIAPVPAAPAPVPVSETPELSAPDRSAASFGIGPTAEESLSAPEEPPPRPRGAVFAQSLGWAALIFLVGAIGWASIEYREAIAKVWPQSATLYRLLRMPVNVLGITITNVTSTQEYEDGQPVLSVTGRIVNISDREVPVPELRVVLLDDAQHELYQWTFDPGVPTLKPGAVSPFTTRLSRPPPEASNVNVVVAESGVSR